MITVLGAGAFGTALAISLSEAGQDVVLWSRDAAQVRAMQESHENAARLAGVRLPERLRIVDHIPQGDGPILLAVPMQRLRGLLLEHGAALAGRDLVACCKGIELTTVQGPVAILQELMQGSTAAILTGPSFARDIAQGLPTALTLACADAERGAVLQQALTTRNIRIYRTTDTTGAELGGALKNPANVEIGGGAGEFAPCEEAGRGLPTAGRQECVAGDHAGKPVRFFPNHSQPQQSAPILTEQGSGLWHNRIAPLLQPADMAIISVKRLIIGLVAFTKANQVGR